MKAISYNEHSKIFSIQLERAEIENMILYLGHGRNAKGLDALNYDNLGWEESAKIAREQRDNIDHMMWELNNILNSNNL